MAAFEFENLDEQVDYPAVVMLYGGPGEGKTHWALHSMPGPVYVANTEGGRVRFVAKKAKVAGKNLKIKSCASMADVRAVVRAAVTEADPANPGTFVFDSASDLFTYAQDEYMVETSNDKIYPKVTWARVYNKMHRFHKALTGRGFSVVYLCRAKDEYKGDNMTGKTIHEGWKNLPYMSDVVAKIEEGQIHIQFNKLQRPNVKFKPFDTSMSWQEIFLHLSDPASTFISSGK